MEMMVCQGKCEVRGYEWVKWVPRRFNEVADMLANMAMDMRREKKADVHKLYYHNRAEQRKDVVLFTDAGIRRHEGTAGRGWVVITRRGGTGGMRSQSMEHGRKGGYQ